MKTTYFNAQCPFEIGDKVILNKNGDVDMNNIHTITDIAAIHKVRSSSIVFAYELDNSGQYVTFK